MAADGSKETLYASTPAEDGLQGLIDRHA